MHISKKHEYLRARILQLLLDGAEQSTRYIMVNLSLREARRGTNAGPRRRVDMGANLAAGVFLELSNLVTSGLLESPRDGVYRITAEGKKMAEAHPGRIEDRLLRKRGAEPIKMKILSPKLRRRFLGKRGYGTGLSMGFPGTGSLPKKGLGAGSGFIGKAIGGGAPGGVGARNPRRPKGLGTRKITVVEVPNIPRPAGAFIAHKAAPKTPRPAFNANAPGGGTAATAPGKKKFRLIKDPRDVRVWFGTNRKPTFVDLGSTDFSNEMDGVVHHGYCDVNVPKGYVRGGSGRGWIRRLLAGEKTSLKLRLAWRLAVDDFWAHLGSSLAERNTDDSLLLFIHGYRTSFKQAAEGAARLSYELSLPVAFFSWPSKGTLAGYFSDSDTVEDSVDALMAFISRLSEECGSKGKMLHVIAHSMGNRALLGALEKAITLGRKLALEQVIFAAPDVPVTRFKSRLESGKDNAKGYTLYASKSDLPVRASKIIHQNPRAGFIPPITVAPPAKTIDVTKYKLSLLGHGYCFGLGSVLEDMGIVLHGGRPRLRTFVVEDKCWVLG